MKRVTSLLPGLVLAAVVVSCGGSSAPAAPATASSGVVSQQETDPKKGWVQVWPDETFEVRCYGNDLWARDRSTPNTLAIRPNYPACI